jgi:hypothetical protein
MAIITGKDGLPYCTDCRGEYDLCTTHKRAVTRELNFLRTALILVSAEGDIRPLLTRKKWSTDKERRKRDEDQRARSGS